MYPPNYEAGWNTTIRRHEKGSHPVEDRTIVLQPGDLEVIRDALVLAELRPDQERRAKMLLVQLVPWVDEDTDEAIAYAREVRSRT